MVCKKCVLPEAKPDIVLDSDGVCNVCLDFERNRLHKEKIPLESEIIKVLNKFRGKNKYDCLVMCSGGKDSTFSLYLMKKRYRLNPLAFTFDHGFENEEALANIRNAVSALGVDWIYYRTDEAKEIFSQMIKSQTKAPICHVCAIWYLKFTLECACRYKTPLIIAGWTKGQSLEKGDSGVEYRAMSGATAEFVEQALRKNPNHKNFPRSAQECVRNAPCKVELISPHWFINYDNEEIKKVLSNELKWKAPHLSYPAGSTNCLFNFVSVYLSMHNYGYTHYHVEMSKLIRKGELSREEALRALAITFDRPFIEGILRKIGCTLNA